MDGTSQPIFAGLSAEELAALLEQLQHRRFPAGTHLLQEGDSASAMYIIRSGNAEVLIADRYGRHHKVDHTRPGDVLGEMSLLTGEPVSATVRALTDIEALVIDGDAFERIGVAFPLIFRNLGVLLADRLRRSHLRSLRPHGESTTVLQDAGAHTPALLAYALACSMGWHTQRPVLLVVLGDQVPADLETLADQTGVQGARPASPGAKLLVLRPEGDYALASLASTLDRLSDSYDHVLLLSTGRATPSEAPGLKARFVRLAGPEGSPVTDASGGPESDPQRRQTLRAWVPVSQAQAVRPYGPLDIPPLEAADVEALRTGLLPASTPAGQALGRAARELCGLKVGLALGAGSEKGYAHVGVLRVLQRVGVPLDCLAGTSVGASVAACLAGGHNLDEIEHFITRVSRAAFKLRFPGASLFSSAGMRDALRAIAGTRRFEDLPVPLAIVAADLLTGREIVFRRGIVWPALLASMAIPGIFPAQRIGPYMLVDGGILNPVPSDVVAGLGADKVIAVKLSSNPSPLPLEAETAEPGGQPPSAFQVLRRSIDIMQNNVTTHTARAATVLIEPAFRDPGNWRSLRSFVEGTRHIEAGEAAAEAVLPQLAAVLPWLKGG